MFSHLRLRWWRCAVRCAMLNMEHSQLYYSKVYERCPALGAGCVCIVALQRVSQGHYIVSILSFERRQFNRPHTYTLSSSCLNAYKLTSVRVSICMVNCIHTHVCVTWYNILFYIKQDLVHMCTIRYTFITQLHLILF